MAAPTAWSVELARACDPQGIQRTCHECVHCLIAAARDLYSRSHPSVCEADMAAAMIRAFEDAEGEELHIRPPEDRRHVAGLLMSTATDLYRQALPRSI